MTIWIIRISLWSCACSSKTSLYDYCCRFGRLSSKSCYRLVGGEVSWLPELSWIHKLDPIRILCFGTPLLFPYLLALQRGRSLSLELPWIPLEMVFWAFCAQGSLKSFQKREGLCTGCTFKYGFQYPFLSYLSHYPKVFLPFLSNCSCSLRAWRQDFMAWSYYLQLYSCWCRDCWACLHRDYDCGMSYCCTDFLAELADWLHP